MRWLFVLLLVLSGCASSERIVWHSTPLGDFAPDTRDPRVVCGEVQEEQELGACRLLEAKRSQDAVDCPDGMSPAGCIACEFSC